jgi:hypothetical protein
VTGPAEHPAIVELERGREAYANNAWTDAYELLLRVDQETKLEADDIGTLATAAFMLGRDDEALGFLERAHHAYLDVGDSQPAVRCAFWVGMILATRGEMGPASGWLGRAQRLLEREQGETVEHGYMLLPSAFQYEASGDFDAAAVVTGQAAAIGERFGDRDLFALATRSKDSSSSKVVG